jgi:N-methylhydantoinase A
LLTTQGFRDIYEIGRVNRPESYNLFFQKHQPLIERALRFEIRERIDAQGKVLVKLDEDQVRGILADLVKSGIEAIAILFLHSYRNPEHERRVKQIVQEAYPGLFVSASHELSQEYREFERSSTVAANAYIGPRVRNYLSVMNSHLGDAGFDGTFLIVQSNGGLFDVDEARDSCIRMLESGPAAGVIGTKILCDSMGLANAIAFDMGGTTAKAGVIHDGNVLMTGGSLVGGYASGLPVQMPMIDIQEVGTARPSTWCCSRAMPTSCVRVVAAALVLRSNVSPKRSRTTCAKATSPKNRRSAITASSSATVNSTPTSSPPKHGVKTCAPMGCRSTIPSHRKRSTIAIRMPATITIRT